MLFHVGDPPVTKHYSQFHLTFMFYKHIIVKDCETVHTHGIFTFPGSELMLRWKTRGNPPLGGQKNLNKKRSSQIEMTHLIKRIVRENIH